MKSLNWRMLALAVCASLAWTASPVGAAESMMLYVGEVKVIDIAPVERVAVGNGSLLSTSITRNGQLILLAEGTGDTAIHIWHQNGSERDITVFIQPSNASRAALEVQQILTAVEGISVRDIGGRSVLEGEYDPKYQPVVDVILGGYPDVLNLTRPLSVVQDKMVYFHVVITEFSTRDLQNLGVDWDNQINGPGGGFAAEVQHDSASILDTMLSPEVLSAAASSAVPAFGFFGIATEITSRINILVQDGDAIILAEPRLSARSGGKAEFLVGGEVPTVATGGLGDANVEYKDFGIKLEIEPVVDSFGNVIAHVAAEISTIDRDLTVQGNPGFRNRRTSTDISMREKDTLVISGLVSTAIGQSVEKVPWLGDIPVLGELFKSTLFNAEQTELVIFVTPVVVDANSKINQEELARQQRLIERFTDATGRDVILE